MHEPIDVALRLRIPVLHQQACELKVRAVDPLPSQLQRQRLTAAERGPIGDEVAHLGVEVRLQHRKGGNVGVEGSEVGVRCAEEVLDEVGGEAFVQPEEADLAVVDEVGATVLDPAERGADRGRDDQVARFRVREAAVVREGVQGYDARVEEEGEFERGGGFDEAHAVGAAVRGFVAGFEGARFQQAERVHGELLEVLGEDELARRVRARGHAPVPGQDVNGLFRHGVADFFKGAFGHASGGCETNGLAYEVEYQSSWEKGRRSIPSLAMMLTTAS